MAADTPASPSPWRAPVAAGIPAGTTLSTLEHRGHATGRAVGHFRPAPFRLYEPAAPLATEAFSSPAPIVNGRC
ncbi:hypothetical protein FPZ12_041610 [Amycolatopsis acidicola]|uniref:Uncharacterized protein n=1 Tax=Amycolatopsis acidicola TaxID=2596893 RepID=A0A5N0UP19_9PSEU|nr:hypothetical protein FPZ12_041610 [Amycolatopsis acidicola]